jgi:hypothetical protein
MAIIRSGGSSDELYIDPNSKAARVSPYDLDGLYVGSKATYRAGTTAVLVAAVTANAPWFVIQGSASKIIRIQRIQISGLSLTAVAYLTLGLAKYSTNYAAGTSTALTQVPLDSNFPAGTSNGIRVFTVAPTAGTLVGLIASRRVMGQAATAAAAGIPKPIDFDFRRGGEAVPPVLNGTSQELGLIWPVAPASAVSMLLEVEWTEE